MQITFCRFKDLQVEFQQHSYFGCKTPSLWVYFIAAQFQHFMQGEGRINALPCIKCYSFFPLYSLETRRYFNLLHILLDKYGMEVWNAIKHLFGVQSLNLLHYGQMSISQNQLNCVPSLKRRKPVILKQHIYILKVPFSAAHAYWDKKTLLLVPFDCL